jgi:spermidine synthase
MKKSLIYYFCAFFTGLAVMAVEFLTTRMIAPYFGNSLYVWTNIVALVMLALAAGYFFGGKLADKNHSEKIYFSIIAVTGIWILLLPFFSQAVLTSLVEVSPDLSFMVRWGSFLGVFILIVLPEMLFGMLVPYTLKLLAKNISDIGKLSGRVSAVSTFGSIMGTFLPAFLLIPYVGVSKSFVILGAMLILISLLGMRKNLFALIVLPAFFLLSIVPEVYAFPSIIYSDNSPYHFIFIKQEGERLELMLDSQFGIHSVYDPSTPILKEYYSYFGVLPQLLKEPKKVLILGHAGGSFTRVLNTFYPELDITGVEIDPAITEAAKKYMALDEADVEIVHGDARAFLLKSSEKYDLIFIDAYYSTGIPAHLTSDEFFALVKSHLSENSLVALNVLSIGDELHTILSNTLAKSMGDIYSVEVPNSFNNMVFAGDLNFDFESQGELAELSNFVKEKAVQISYDADSEIFTDEKNRIDIISEKMIMEFYELASRG